MDEEFFYDKLKRLGLQDKTLNGLVDLIDDQKKEIERLKDLNLRPYLQGWRNY